MFINFKNNVENFDDLDLGVVFCDDRGSFFVKVREIVLASGEVVNAMSIDTANFIGILPDTEVLRLDSRLIIEEPVSVKDFTIDYSDLVK